MSHTTRGSAAFDRIGREFTSWAARVTGYSRLLISASEKLELFSRTLQSKGLDTTLTDQIRSVGSILPKENAVVFDVGANVGNWTRELLKLAGPSIAQVHCFEPIPTNIDAIRSLNDPRVVVHPFAVGMR
ncbi:MAG TPA: hypothetical protein VGC15_14620, partial [Acetobacteraceae bacterium]